jgi:hypothetical protein
MKKTLSEKMRLLVENRSVITILLVLGIAAVYFLLYGAIDVLITSKLIPVFSKISESIITDLILFISFLISSYYLISKFFLTKVRINKISLLIAGILLLIYFLHRQSLFPAQSWYYLSLKSISWLKYSDFVIYPILISAIKVSLIWGKSDTTLSATSSSFIEDNHISFGNKDLLKREKLANRVAKLIEATKPQNSFAIGIIGDWGSGKSIFLGQIKKFLVQNHIIVDFNPWRHSSSKSLLEDFFFTLTTTLKKYDPKLSKQVQTYYLSLISVDDNAISRLLKYISSLIYPEQTIQDQYDSIKDSITEYGFRIVIFIDDLDRLDNDEIIETLRIIRNTADFPNTFFITAYDQDYILKSIEKSKIPNLNKYLEKIFQLEISLPAYPDNVIVDALYSLLEIDRDVEELNIIRSSIDSLRSIKIPVNDSDVFAPEEYNLIRDFITNLRDVVRFVNSFNLDYSLLKDEVDITDFIIIELIKHKHNDVYKSIVDQLVVKGTFSYFSFKGNFSGTNNKLTFEAEKAIKVLGLEYYNQLHGIPPVIKALNYLVNIKKSDGQRAFVNPMNSLLFFSTDLFDRVSFRDFNSHRIGSFDGFRHFIRECIDLGKADELVEIFIRTHNYNNRTDFKNMILGMVYLSSVLKLPWSKDITNRLKKVQFNVKNYFQSSQAEYNEFIKSIFEEAKYPFLIESEIVYSMLDPFLKDPLHSKEIMTKKELSRYLLKYLRQYCSSKQTTSFNASAFELYKRNVLSIDPSTNYVNFKPEANRLMRKYIEKFPQDYLAILIQPIPLTNGIFTMDITTTEIFGSYSEFENFLYGQPNTKVTLEAKSFFIKFKNITRTVYLIGLSRFLQTVPVT